MPRAAAGIVKHLLKRTVCALLFDIHPQYRFTLHVIYARIGAFCQHTIIFDGLVVAKRGTMAIVNLKLHVIYTDEIACEVTTWWLNMRNAYNALCHIVDPISIGILQGAVIGKGV